MTRIRIDMARKAHHAARRGHRLAALLFGFLLVLTATVPAELIGVVAAAGESPNSTAESSSSTAESPNTSSGFSTTVTATRDVTVVAFQQSWNTIADECERVYGPEGVGYVQISPPQESVRGTEWWTVYQPVSYEANSRFGTEAELQSMIERCNAVGVDIIADVVLNHTTGTDVSWVDDQLGVNGTAYNGTYGRYLGIGITQYEESGNNYQYGVASGDFHKCRSAIVDYSNATEVQECRLSTMWDINTGSEKVREIQADYLAYLWNLGVRGYRVDSAKHISTTDLAAIKAKLATKIGVDADDIMFQQEVIYHDTDAASLAPSTYTGTGQVSEFEFAYRMLHYFTGSVSSLQSIGTDGGMLDSDDATVFVANWDTVRGSETLNYSSGSRYEMATAFMLAYGYGQPQILSDYYFLDYDEGAAGTTETGVIDVDLDAACAAMDGTTKYTDVADGQWLCQQRWTSVRGMIGFHNAVGDATVSSWQEPANANAGFARTDADGQDVGFFAVNNALQAHEVTYVTNLPDGVYCDVYNSSDCSATVTVEGGQFTTTVARRGAVAIYYSATVDNWATLWGADSAVGADGVDRSAEPGYDDQPALERIADTSLTIYFYLPDSYGWDAVYVQVADEGTLLNDEPVRMTKSAEVVGADSLTGNDSSATVCSGVDDDDGSWYQATVTGVGTSKTLFRFTNDPSGGSGTAGAGGTTDGAGTDDDGTQVAGDVADDVAGDTAAGAGDTGVAVADVEDIDDEDGATGVVWDYADGLSTEGGSTPYEAAAGTTAIAVRGHATTLGVPYSCSTATTTLFTVHFKATSAAAQAGATGVVVRGTDVSGAEMPATYYPFDATADSWGRRMTATLPGDFLEVNYRIVNADGLALAAGATGEDVDSLSAVAGTGESYNAAVLDNTDDESRRWTEKVRGAIESWLDGTVTTDGAATAYDHSEEYRNAASTPSPNDVKNPQTVTVIVHYMRPDGDYQQYDLDADTWNGWDLWMWTNETTSGSAIQFTGHDDFGVVATATFTEPAKGNRNVMFIVRQGADSWTAKDPDGYNRAVPESAIRVAAGDSSSGVAEIWVVSGDPTVYTYRPAVAGVTFETGCDGSCADVAGRAVPVGGTVAGLDADETPVRDGYLLDGWNTAADGSGDWFVFGDGGTVVTARTVLYAQWTKGIVVTFDVGDDSSGTSASAGATGSGGASAAPDAQTIRVGSTATEPVTPTRTGYEFVGWTVADGTGESGGSGAGGSGQSSDLGTVELFDFSTPLTEDTVLVAVWEPCEYEVKVVVGDGTEESFTVKYGETVDATALAKLADGASVDGRKFVGWTVDAAGTTPYNVAAAVTGELTIYGKWVDDDVDVTLVTFHAAYEDGVLDMSGDVQLYAVVGETMGEPVPDPVRDGYRFAGWTTDFTSLEHLFDFGTDVVTENLELYPLWVKTWPVTFDLNYDGAPAAVDAYPALATQTVDDGACVADPGVEPAHGDDADRYEFLGWYVDAGLTTPFVFCTAGSGESDGTGGSGAESGAESGADDDESGGTATSGSGGTAVTGDLTLVARWEKAGSVWTIKFDLNGGSAPAGHDAAFADQKVFDGEYLTKPAVNPVRDGYVFQGWTTVKNDMLALSFAGSGSTFGFDSSGRSLIPIDRNGTLYALWSKA
ncbi:InlB B-repeat-containing protein [Bifidobacterium choloepi]|uniref:Alpha-amylase n=1 Tax=Bifidobacterium choloepi TaxID=2614131 RepID=A0A6I5N072_9BIFI|nr:InlB B-repeat-containing protein [Bifidobacterium choloepi]NEG69957.1 hypothetical protein [Bifidobacterium choloepi]